MSALLPSEVLARAADLIEPEGRWIQGGAAKNAAGQYLGAGGAASKAATCWCAIGALLRTGPDQAAAALDYLRTLISPTSGIGGWNDAPDRTQAEVVAALRKASELAASEGQ